MPRKLLKKYLPDPAHLREHKHLRMFGERLADPNIWHLNRRSVAGGTFIGMFCALLPMPFQTLPAAMLSILFRVNLPIAIALCWVTNPLTMVPFVWAAYHIGAFLLGSDTNWSVGDIGWDWMWANYPPLFVGSIVLGVVLGGLGYVAVHYIWRLHIRRQMRLRAERRQQRVAAERDEDRADGR